ncbi:exonuclease domain-containing protein [Sphingomonas sp. NPDC079357]|uniref:exonuclease domain-containing protein n=1 Tax=Sphingomonas sp. NPDC079357 TaxID=3364518 RepID=UPI00384B17BA
MITTPSRADQMPDFVVIDVETACSRVSSICQVAIVGFRDGRELFAWETLLDPCDDFHPMNSRIHGICAHHVAGQPTFAHVHAMIDGHLSGAITVAHSMFDKGALAAACRMHGCDEIEAVWLDSVRVAKRAWPDLPNHKLGNLARFLGVEHRHHDALSDARAAGWVLVRAIEHTGLSLADWMAPVRPGGPAPRAAPSGPLSGERVVIVGEPRDGQLAHAIAAAGGVIRSSVGSTTTLVVIGGDGRFEAWLRTDPQVRKAEQLLGAGQRIAITTASSIDRLLG